MKPELIKADWSPFERRPTWSVISSRELAKVLSVSLQTINNWKMRGFLPEPESHPKLIGNKNYFRISKIKAWLENKSENRIHWDWAQQWLPDYVGNIKTLEQVEFVVKSAYDLLGVEKPLISASFTND